LCYLIATFADILTVRNNPNWYLTFT
jgi:hypothetical protein